jgi:hypothetical protein
MSPELTISIISGLIGALAGGLMGLITSIVATRMQLDAQRRSRHHFRLYGLSPGDTRERPSAEAILEVVNTIQFEDDLVDPMEQSLGKIVILTPEYLISRKSGLLTSEVYMVPTKDIISYTNGVVLVRDENILDVSTLRRKGKWIDGVEASSEMAKDFIELMKSPYFRPRVPLDRLRAGPKRGPGFFSNQPDISGNDA